MKNSLTQAQAETSDEEIFSFFFSQYLPSIGMTEDQFLDDFVRRFGRGQLGRDGRTLELSPVHLKKWIDERGSDSPAIGADRHEAQKNPPNLPEVDPWVKDKIDAFKRGDVKSIASAIGDQRFQEGIDTYFRVKILRWLFGPISWITERPWARKIAFWGGIGVMVYSFYTIYQFWLQVKAFFA